VVGIGVGDDVGRGIGLRNIDDLGLTGVSGRGIFGDCLEDCMRAQFGQCHRQMKYFGKVNSCCCRKSS